MRWFEALSKRQQIILIVLFVAVLGTIGTMGWVIWSTVQGNQQASPLPTTTTPPSIISTPTPKPTATDTPEPTPTPIPTFDVSHAGLVAADVVDARGLRLRLGVPLTLVTEHEMSVVLYQHYEDYPPFTTVENDLLAVLKLDSDIGRIDPVEQAEGIAAIYFPEIEELYLRRDWSGSQDELELQLAYAYARALSDQTGNLPSTNPEGFTLDLQLALDAVKQSNALYTLWRYMDIAPASDAAASIADHIIELHNPVWREPVPRYAELNQFTTELGMMMALQHYADNGQAALDNVMERPPRSTEQLLHIEQYTGDDLPDFVSAIAPSLDNRTTGEGWTEVRAETLGEALAGWVFSEWLHKDYDIEISAGWGGDYLQIWESEEGQTAAAWHFVWDSAILANEQYQMLLDLMPSKLLPGVISDRTPASGLPSGRWWAGGQGAVYMRRYANQVWLIWGSDNDFVEYLAANL